MTTHRNVAPVSDPAISSKLSRLAQGEAPRVLDLFAGCGGLSLGFQSERCAIVGAVELDPIAANSHASNFYRAQPTQRNSHSQPRDIVSTEPRALLRDIGLGTSIARQIDIVVGGPP